MPAETTPSSLSELIQDVQAAQAASGGASSAVATEQHGDASAASPTATDTADTTEAAGQAAAGDEAQTDGSDGAQGTEAATPASIDWGAAMPALAAKAAELLGEEAGVLTKYGDIDSLIRSIAAREKQVGQQSAYVGAFNQLAAAGVTLEDLQSLMQTKRGGGQPATSAGHSAAAGSPNGVQWRDEFFAGRDGEGKPIFNRVELARAGVTETQAAQAYVGWQEQLADVFSSPQKVQQFIASIVDPRLGYVAQQTEQKLTNAQQVEQARREQAATAAAWANSNANLLYVNKKDPNGGVTKFYQDMEAVMQKLNPKMSWTEQLNEAKNIVLARNRPAPATPAASDKARRQPASGAQPSKLSIEEFHTKFSDRYSDPHGLGLAEWLAYETTGKVPEARK